MRKRHCFRKENWKNKFSNYGYRMTAARETIIKVLQETNEHLSADEIFMRARKINPDVGLTTVYRTLAKLSDIGEINSIDFGDNRLRFELTNSEKGHHHHLVCIKCNKIIDYDDFIDEEVKLLSNIKEKLENKYYFKINNHLIQFYGVCNDCNK
jgi:Fur family ferric uptake transcriptional regulator